MAGLLPSFLAAAQLEIRIGSTILAYAQNCAWTDDMTTAAIGGIGAYSFHGLEPLAYIGRGSLTITHYSSLIFNALKAAKNSAALPENLRGTSLFNGRDGNSLLVNEFFNPIQMLIARTFDINIYERSFQFTGNAATAPTDTNLVFTLKDCRMTNLSFTFTPGTLLNQVASFLCLSVIDHTAENADKYIVA